ncbi:MAG: hypothetical protein AAB869_01270 [Patescibacteria group bacterium]
MIDKKPEKKFDRKLSGEKVATSFAEIAAAAAALFIILPLAWLFFSSIWNSGLSDIVANTLAFLRLVATVVSMLALLVAAYSFMRFSEIMTEEKKKLGVVLAWEHERTEKNHRWERVEEHMRSQNPSDWKMAILDADNILDEIVERMGYRGETLGERMKMIEPSDFPYLDDAWRAHKMRNDIAHQGGADYVLTHSLAEGTINIYHRIFKELGYL